MAPGWRREDPEIAPGATGGPWEGLGGGRGGHERSELTFSSVLRPSDALSQRFPIFVGLRMLSHCLVIIWEALCRNVHQTFTTE